MWHSYHSKHLHQLLDPLNNISNSYWRGYVTQYHIWDYDGITLKHHFTYTNLSGKTSAPTVKDIDKIEPF